MITVRQIDKLWNARAYDRLLERLLAPRPEASARLLEQLSSHQLSSQQLCQTAVAGGGASRVCVGGMLPAAAMLVVRLDELAQAYVPLYSQSVRTVLMGQRPDGGWGDTMVTALCIRALLCGKGHGVAIERGLASLAALQKEEGIWPGIPVRRMPVDSFASAFVLMQLGDAETFRQAVQFDRAVEWFRQSEPALDAESKKLWSHAKRRSVPARVTQPRTAVTSAKLATLNFGDLLPA